MGQRILSLHFSRLALDRIELEKVERKDRPCAISTSCNDHLHISAANEVALKAGISRGMCINDARLLARDIEVIPENPNLDRSTLLAWVRWCNRYTPIATEDGSGGILLNITGCTRLFGGEAALLCDLENRVRAQGYEVCGAIAHNFGAAWALARYSECKIVNPQTAFEALCPLPIEALRLSVSVATQLRHIGISTVGSLLQISRDALSVRYGSEIILRIDQIFHDSEEAFAPFRAPGLYRAAKSLDCPIANLESLACMLKTLLSQVCLYLRQDGCGARQLRVDYYRVDGEIFQCSINTIRSTCNVDHLHELVAEKIGTIDFGCGVERLVITATTYQEIFVEQLSFTEHSKYSSETLDFSKLLDRLGIRFGFEAISRFRICESLFPEFSAQFYPAIQPAVEGTRWPEYRLRPTELIIPPRCIHVNLAPNNLPVKLQIEGKWRNVVFTEGPERLSSEWWRDDFSSFQQRDYFRIADSQSNRFWIFRDANNRWYLHGHFA